MHAKGFHFFPIRQTLHRRGDSATGLTDTVRRAWGAADAMQAHPTLLDGRACAVSGATPVALEAFEDALGAFQSWRSGVEGHLARALREAPAMVMAHVLRVYRFLSSRDPHRVDAAREVMRDIAGLPANARERMHFAAIAAVLADDYEAAKRSFGHLLDAEPRDVLALQMAHAFDYLTGDVAHLRGRAAAVLPAWTEALPGYHAVLSIHAFGLEESGDYVRAEQTAHRALALDPFDARAHHVLAHVFEMTDRPAEGIAWLRSHEAQWASGTVVATHCWWHMALFLLAQHRVDEAISLYDRQVRAEASEEVADMIDAAALLWRIELQDGKVGARWQELAACWAPHVGDGFCTFSDLHAMISFVGARDWSLANRLERDLARRAVKRSRHGLSTRLVGLAACRAVRAYGRGEYAVAVRLLADLPALAHRIGGSHAQRDVLTLTLPARAPTPRSREEAQSRRGREHATPPLPGTARRRDCAVAGHAVRRVARASSALASPVLLVSEAGVAAGRRDDDDALDDASRRIEDPRHRARVHGGLQACGGAGGGHS